MRNQLFFNLIILLLLSSCDKNNIVDPNAPPELPPLTFEGKNTLGCKINGKNWVASVGINLNGDFAFRMSYDSISNYFRINSWWIDKFKGIDQNLSLESYISKNTQIGFPIIRNIRTPNFSNFNNWLIEYWIESKLNNNLEITFIDRKTKIISGKFELTVIDTLNADTLFVTEGRFDGRY